MKGIMLQAFEWNLPDDGNHYKKLIEKIHELKSLNITGIWMPPPYKGSGKSDTGYTAYDYWDMGEYDQKGTIRTKYGFKQDLLKLINKLHQNEIQIYADLVYNHKGSADYAENFLAVKINPENREETESQPYEIRGYTGFDFPGRKCEKSKFVWHHYHFNGVDYDESRKENGIFRIIGENKYWEKDTSKEKGNYDYLMNADIDHNHPEVIEELFKFSEYLVGDFKYDGFRYDALKHISRAFINDHTKRIMEIHKNLYYFGEYWSDNIDELDNYIKSTEGNVDLFDVPLHIHLHLASTQENFNMRTIFDNTLVSRLPDKAVTFVDNHDTQPGQALFSWVDEWFKEIAYAIILLRKDGYPCVFWSDLYGLQGNDYEGIYDKIQIMCKLRKECDFQTQTDYFMSESMIGWVLSNTHGSGKKLVVLISTDDKNECKMYVDKNESGKKYIDRSGKNEAITIDEEGNGVFTVAPGSVTYWTIEN